MNPTTLQNENLLYQYRPLSRKDDNGLYKDIERLKKCEIYFSQLEQLNDPLDGKIHFTWNADRDVWKGLIYHYANILFTRLHLAVLCVDFSEIKNFHVHGYIDNDLSFKKSLRTALDKFFTTESGEEILRQLSTENKLYTNDIVSFFNFFVHHEILLIITSLFAVTWGITERGIEFLVKKVITEHDYMKNHILSDKEDIDKEIQLVAKTEAAFTMEFIKTKMDSVPEEFVNSPIHAFRYIKYLFCSDFFEKFQNHALHQWCVSSFSNDCANALMWAHYAESHKGVCLVFDIGDKFDYHNFFNSDDLSEYFNHSVAGIYRPIRLEKVKYEDGNPEVNIFRTLMQFANETIDEIFSFYDGGYHCFYNRDEWIEETDKLYKMAVAQKSEKWAYENEIRMIMTGLHERYKEAVKNKKTCLRFNLSKLKGVIFGVYTSTDDKFRLIEAIKEMYKNEKEKPLLYQALYSEVDNTISISPLLYANAMCSGIIEGDILT